VILIEAVKSGFSIPETFVVNRKESIDSGKGLIFKSLKDPIEVTLKEQYWGMMYTMRLIDQHFEKLPNNFMPSLLQAEIDKDYELRVFYICEKIFPMAIFSQSDKQTKLDFRNYNYNTPNRTVPCRLPEVENKQIVRFMKRIKLNCGSIDFIRGKNGKLYFLEVNPTGQFGMVDFPCNYGLHKVVAETLIKNDK